MKIEIELLASILEVKPPDLEKLINLFDDPSFHPYIARIRKKQHGKGMRFLHIPNFTPLKITQRCINNFIARYQDVPNEVFGFSGGTLQDAISFHLKSQYFLSMDLKNAFRSVRENAVQKAFWKLSEIQIMPGKDKLTQEMLKLLVLLTTYRGTLPQGTPSSPRIFDLVFSPVDKEISDFSESQSVCYTRYTDNLLFSSNSCMKRYTSEIVNIIQRGGFTPHKIKIHNPNPKCFTKILGFNVKDGRPHNTKANKKKLRKKIHHLEWLLQNKSLATDIKGAWSRLQGFTSTMVYEESLEGTRRKVRQMQKEL